MAELKLTKDAVFKILFGSHSSVDALKSLIESVLNKKIKNIRILNPYVDRKVIEDKSTILDIKAEALFEGAKETYNVEIQVRNQTFFHHRSLYYWAQSYGGQLKGKATYDTLCKHICMNFLDFDLLKNGRFVSTYLIMEKDLKEPLTDHLEMHFVQMKLLEYNKMSELPSDGTMLERWVYFLMNGHRLRYEEANALDHVIAETQRKFEEIQSDRDLIVAIEMRYRDDLFQKKMSQREAYISQIKRIGKEIHVSVPEHIVHSLEEIDEDKLSNLVFTLLRNSELSESVYMAEIKSLLENK